MFNKRWVSMVVGSGLAILLLAGLLVGLPAFAQGGGMMGNGRGMMGNSDFGPGWMMRGTPGFSGTNPFGFGPGWMMHGTPGFSGTVPFGPGMMGMMHSTPGFSGTVPFGPGMMGMMGNFFSGDGGLAGMMGGGMMVNPNNPFYTTPQPLTLDEVTTTLEAYLAALDDANLVSEDIMIFDNHAYAQIVEQDSGTGVMEVLIDPTTKAVYPEMGPNMMWNQKYGMMSGFGRYGMMSMMGGFNNGMMGNADSPAELTVTPAQAVETAQSYLDTNFSDKGFTVDDQADPFYGYYTLHVNQEEETVGMLSVNGFTVAVWPHTWHGQLLAMGAE